MNLGEALESSVEGRGKDGIERFVFSLSLSAWVAENGILYVGNDRGDSGEVKPIDVLRLCTSAITGLRTLEKRWLLGRISMSIETFGENGDAG